MGKESSGLNQNNSLPKGGDSEKGAISQFLKTDGGRTKSNAIEIPSISLPKGGGAIKGIDEKFSVNAVNGTASFSIPLPFSPARGASPALSLSYNSGAGNGVFGLGWMLSLPSIKRKTDKRLPQYLDGIDSDTFLFSEAEDLVPEFKKEANGKFSKDADGNYIIKEKDSLDHIFTIRFYKPRIEGLFARIERWTHKTTGEIKWRVITKENVTTLFGWSAASRISDPKDVNKIFEWLPEFVFDDKGNCSHYIYKKEDDKDFNTSLLHNRNRTENGKITYTNLYLEKVLYGNKTPYKKFGESYPSEDNYLFKTVFDYGKYDQNVPDKLKDWDFRQDAFSEYKSGFEIRTTRLCKRVLLFHRFDGANEYNGLVKSLNFEYDTSSEADFTFLKSITAFGYIKKPDGTYSYKNLPPTEFEYQKHDWNKDVNSISPDDLVHAPAGLDEPLYQFTDLFNEGLSGILTEQANGWYYKHNLGNGQFEQAKLVTPKPSFVGLGSQLQLADLDADGGKQLVSYGAQPRGYFELSDEDEWQPFRTFDSLPNIDLNDANTRMLDLNGDGRPEALITEENVFTWYESAGRKGFTEAYRTPKSYDEEKCPHLVFADPKQTIFLADMSGDGMTDIVRIRNGEVCYWPNLGYGKFGAKVGMDNAPVFDHPDSFNPAYLRLADIDGSGTTDIIYLGKSRFSCWKNLSGNCFSSTAFEIDAFPEIHNQSKITVTDLLGNGVACIVWSSNLTKDAAAPLKYIDLMNSKKPHIMVFYKNNLGKEVTLEYTPSTKFYIEDKLAGKPWVTKLHFPVHCVEKTTVKDKWRKIEFSSTYSYHHGFYDHSEREFRGFGRVEQRDVESYGKFEQGNVDSPYITNNHDLYQPPIKSITWYHTGAAFERDRILSVFQQEYFRVPGFIEHQLPEPTLTPDNLSTSEWREAARACKGMMLRQEVFELDVDALTRGEELPVRLFTTAYHNSDIKCLQPQGTNHHAVFLVTESEAITYNYELDLRTTPLNPDPRIAHTLNLRFDDYGRTMQSVAVVYPRQAPYSENTLNSEQAALIRIVQGERHLVYIETHYTAPLPENQHKHRLPAPCEIITYELTGSNNTLGFLPSSAGYFTLNDLRAFRLSDALPGQGSKAVTTLDYQLHPSNQNAHKRIVERVCMLYFKDDLSGAEPFGTYAWIGLPYETYKLALTRDLLNAVLGAKLTPDILTNLDTATISGYTPGITLSSTFTDQWWIRSGIAGFADDAADHFYLPEKYTDPFGNVTTLAYDGKYDLFIQSSTDALGNTNSVRQFDYRVLAPCEMLDINGNHTEVYFDILGMVVASAIKGKGNEGDDLIGFDIDLANPSAADVQMFCTNGDLNIQKARDWLGHATARFVYHFGEGRDTNGNFTGWADRPAGACGIVREIHFHATGGADSPLQVALECSDGGGNVLMKKIQAEPEQVNGPLRWIVNGLTVLNNKGKPVKQYEPSFVSVFGCTLPTAEGVTPIMYYDAPGRLVRTEMPDGSLSRVEFSPWQVTSFDANDTVLESQWYQDRNAPDPTQPLSASATPDTRAAWLAAWHANTPSQTHLDSLGREVISIAHNRVKDAAGNWQDEQYLTFTKLDAEGKPLWIRDACGNLVMQYITPAKPNNDPSDAMPVNSVPCYDIAGNLLFQHSMDAGDRWMLMDAAGKPMLAWDMNETPQGAASTRENRFYTTDYDKLHRPTAQWLTINNGARIMVEKYEYQDAESNDVNNLNGQLILHYDPSGRVEIVRRDFKGNVLETKRRLNNQPTESLIDWKTNPENFLETETFTQITEFDALNRMTLHYNWHRAAPDNLVAVYKPFYNERGLLLSEILTVRARKTAGGFNTAADTKTSDAIKDIRYNVKGQKEFLKLGNGTLTQYDYDEKTFRLKQIRTTRPADESDFPSRRSNLVDPNIIQQLLYTYDPVGNIVEIEDHAYKPVFFSNAIVEPKSLYEYDALYRLTKATGRENGALVGAPTNIEGNAPEADFPITDPGALRKYTQTYLYDPVGNIDRMHHEAGTGTWTLNYYYDIASNRLLQTWHGNDTLNAVTYGYDTHGNMLNLARTDPKYNLQWDHRDMIRSIDLGGGGMAYYQYDSGKQRTRKRIVNQNGLGGYWERIYLGGYERYRRYNAANPNTPVEEIETHHLFEGEQRVLMVDDVISTDRKHGDGTPYKKEPIYRYQYSNHLGSACMELDDVAGIISYEEYHPYGTCAYRAMKSGIEAPPKRYRYTGMERDEESGLEYHSARYYMPWLDRWISCDPAGYEDGLNLYQYSHQNPFSFTDHSGMGGEPSESQGSGVSRNYIFDPVEVVGVPPPRNYIFDPVEVVGIAQKKTLSELSNEPEKRSRAKASNMEVTKFMGRHALSGMKDDPEARKLWYQHKLGAYENQLRESAIRHRVPEQLIAAVILNELADISGVDAVQENMVGGSVGIAQIQVDTAISHGLTPQGEGYRLSKLLGMLAPYVSGQLKVPQIAIDAAAKEIRIQIDIMVARKDMPWQTKYGFDPLGDASPDPQAVYSYVRSLPENSKDEQLRREAVLAMLVSAAYNSPDITKAKKPKKYGAAAHGANAAFIAQDLYELNIFRPIRP